MLQQLAALIGKGEVDNIPNASGDGSDVLAGAINLVFYVTGVVAVVVIIIAGIMYIISTGDQNKIEQAKNMLKYAVAGLVVVILAFTIVQFVLGRF